MTLAEAMMGDIGPGPREQRIVAAPQDWRAATEIAARGEAQSRSNEAAATLIVLGVTLYNLDPMDMLPDDLMPLL